MYLWQVLSVIIAWMWLGESASSFDVTGMLLIYIGLSHTSFSSVSHIPSLMTLMIHCVGIVFLYYLNHREQALAKKSLDTTEVKPPTSLNQGSGSRDVASSAPGLGTLELTETDTVGGLPDRPSVSTEGTEGHGFRDAVTSTDSEETTARLIDIPGIIQSD